MTEQTAAALDREQLRQLVAETIDIELAEVTDEAHFVDDLEIDSLLAMEIAVRLEQEYGVKIEEADISKLTTLDQTYQLLEAKRQALS